jgi:hypothetical protein
MKTRLRLEIRSTERPIWGFGFVERTREWKFTPAETMTDNDVYEWAQKFLAVGCDVNVVEEK